VVALIREKFGVEAEMMPGNRREFSVAVDGKIVARKIWMFFPPEPLILSRVSRALEHGGQPRSATRSR
jgi:hypothetical protein